MLAGAEFFVTPALNLKTVEICKRYSKAILPGVLTPTEVMTAWDAGADMVKIFPCGNMGGPSYINALKAPLPQVLMVPTGGVKLDNTAEFFKAGASAVAVGADICNTKAMAEGRYDEIEALWKQAEEDLKRFRIPHAVQHCYFSDYDHGYPEHHALWWTRHGKAWRIVHEIRTAYSEVDDKHPDECEWKPITECPLDLRLAMIAEFKNLRQKVVEAAEQAVPTLDEAISSFRKILKG